jgi:hypothetical protein
MMNTSTVVEKLSCKSRHRWQQHTRQRKHHSMLTCRAQATSLHLCGLHATRK